MKKENETECKSETIQKLEDLLRLHSMDTEDLIHEYFLERHQETKEKEDETEGTLAVKLIFINDVLKLDILNASNIKAMDSNGECLNLKHNIIIRYLLIINWYLLLATNCIKISMHNLGKIIKD